MGNPWHLSMLWYIARAVARKKENLPTEPRMHPSLRTELVLPLFLYFTSSGMTRTFEIPHVQQYFFEDQIRNIFLAGPHQLLFALDICNSNISQLVADYQGVAASTPTSVLSSLIFNSAFSFHEVSTRLSGGAPSTRVVTWHITADHLLLHPRLQLFHRTEGTNMRHVTIWTHQCITRLSETVAGMNFPFRINISRALW
jgi:hypothetical protein